MSLTVSEVAGLQTSNYFNVAGMAILTYDYVITLEDEARWVWGRKWDVTRFVFTVSRYLPFVGAGLTGYGEHATKVTIGAAVAINVTRAQLLPDGNIPPGCLLIASRNSTFVYLVLLLFEIVILCLMAYKRFHSYRDMSAPIVHATYRDSMFYIVCIILVTFSNVILDGIFPSQFSDLLDIPQIALHSVLASRIIFNLRKSYHDPQESGTTDPAPLSRLVYMRPPGSESTGSGGPSGSRWQGVTNNHLGVNIDLSGFECHCDPIVV
ncbi:hypothetical protein L210DRAFT_3650757 [Boletus edulis BED1]|uniref:DUF6533 domain-containing protein n=1 Tax=Boletus edulis BED1 TaxID=1328754 RepID=A0AAD4G9W5_BOLED|nr:hypothetical protein L210DRAFT_3650757 [Boletus edulis BED1]